MVHDFDWNDLRYFLALARSRNPARAARWLSVDHTTVRRRIAALESSLSAKLFDPRSSGYILTAQGKRLLESVEAMESLAANIESSVADADQAVSGLVRISATQGLGAYFLAARLASFCERHPDIQIQLVTLSRIANISRREADIAIAPEPPERGREVVRKLTDCHLGLYAAEAYLKRSPPIRNVRDLQDHHLIGYIHDLPYASRESYLPQIFPSVRAQFESNSTVAQVRAVEAGRGMAVLPHFVALHHATLRQVLPESFSLRVGYWLIVHPDLRKLARIRALIDFLVAEFEAARTSFVP